MNRALRLSAFVAASLLIPNARAQEAEQGVREQAEAVLVEVPVRVLDKNGSPIRDLTTADFTVYDDGRKQTVIGFDAIDLADKTASGNPGDAVPPAARRRFLILFDFSFARPKAILAARQAAKEFILAGLGDRDLAAVATYSVERGIRLLVTFSSDRAQLARAVDTLGIEAERQTGDPLAFAFDSRSLRAVADTGGGKAEVRASTMIEALDALSQISKARNDEYERGRVRNLIQSFEGLATALSTVEGRKDVIYLSEGFRGRYLVGTKDTDQEKEWLLSGEFWKVDSDKRYGNTSLRNDVSEMGVLFRRTDCVIHAVDIGGIRADGSPEAEDMPIGERQTENSLFDLASATGGEVFRNANDLTGQLGRLTAQLDLVYVLAYRPDRWGEEGKYHELKVKVARSGARVVARAGYFERRSFRRQTPLERNLSAADVIANEIPLHDIPARILATPFAGKEGEASVPVLLEIPGRALVEGEKGDRATAEVYVYAVDAENQLRDFFTQVITLDLTKNVEKLYAGGLKFWGELHLPPGAYRLRALVRNADTGRMGLDVMALRVPAFSPGQPYLLPPVFLESDGDWLVLRSHGRVSGTPDSVWRGIGGEGVSPAAMPPQARPGDPLRLCLVAYHFGAEGPGLKIGSQILAADGRPLGGAALSVLGKSASEPDGRRMVLLSLKTPDGLAPGQYGLRILLEDGLTGEARQASASFVVQ